MKNNIIIASIALFFAFGCYQSNKNNANENRDSTILSDTLSYKMESFFKTEDNCPKDTCDAYVAAKYPIFTNEEINNFVLKLITPAPFKDKPLNSLSIAADTFINDYLAYKKEFPDGPLGYQWDQTLNVTFQNKDFIAFNHTSYAYTGGAHGMQNTFFYNLDRKNFNKITLKDILKPNYQAELTKIGEEIFRKNEKLKPQDNLEAYFFDKNIFILNDNFLITPNGLLFLYNQYEIKAYVYGTTELLIPYSAIKHIIADNSILQNFN